VDFEQVLKEVVWRLVTEGRISYRRIKLSFALDDDGLEELRRELIGLKRLAADAGVRDVDGFARQWQMLMIGSIVAAYAGDRGAARHAKAVGVRLIAAETAPHRGAGGKHRKHQ